MPTRGPSPHSATSGGSGSSFGGMLGGLLGATNPVLGGLFSLAGVLGSNNALSGARDSIQGLTTFSPTNFGGDAGSFRFGPTGAHFANNPLMQMLGSFAGNAGAEGLSGGLFNSPIFQQAFNSNDLQGAFQQAQAPIDTGFLGQQGMAALTQAGDQSGLISDYFNQLQALANPIENQQANKLLDFQQNRGFGGLSSPDADQRAQQANRFLTAGNDRARQAIELGIGQSNALRSFGTQAIGQGFQQGLTQGQTRLQNAMQLFGFGDQLQSAGVQRGVSASSIPQGNAQLALQAILGSLNAESGRIGSTGLHAQSLANLAGGQGGLFGGLGNALGSIFG